ncbi:hypothetical protein JB92DRAFT_2763097 [Gautieria morchelliformis]|nr:hypothetical protein JB92DRAFT_2763097 [Gautieria morchelliformis]
MFVRFRPVADSPTEFPERSRSTHSEHAYEWREIADSKEREAYFKRHGVRWFELARLPYFDPICMTIIDPMHNLLQGTFVKNQWYTVWIQRKALRAATGKKKRELDMIHEYLETASSFIMLCTHGLMITQLEIPSFIGRLVKQVGEPAGGSLTADAYKLIATVYGLIIVSYNICSNISELDHDDAVERWKTNASTWEKKYGERYHAQVVAEAASVSTSQKHKKELKKNQGKGEAKIPACPQRPEERMHLGEDAMFMKLAAAIKIYTSYELTSGDITWAGILYQEYILEFKKAVHLGSQIRDYGPVYGFWCFLDERLNKLLKAIELNNWGNGQLEISMMRAWGQDVQAWELVCINLCLRNTDRSHKVGRSNVYPHPHVRPLKQLPFVTSETARNHEVQLLL